ncbi:hypothetical protein ACJ72_07074 [Emergomyces africanus]|uniref:Arf-GAP domain-containing protein n=1 Tax=Emergomyces africanus TaxID=1955775 RepID=A0A1B7NP62_9EURO|nr:hypothetical protein ACJ72_07074 [Emergomyces africanus]
MGTHISRVKSVDLDTWTDEQLQSVLKWGNSRANKYWEAKLAPGHVPSESKMENFIRTKYESKRWVMDGPMPDPSTLDVDEGDDNTVSLYNFPLAQPNDPPLLTSFSQPLAIVQEKAKLERSVSQRAASTVNQPAPRRPGQPMNLFDDNALTPPERPNTTDLPGIRPPTGSSRPTPSAPAPVPKPNKPADSLLGLDFFGSAQPTANRPSSTPSSTVGSTGPSRPDLKQSILSLYAAAPKPQSPPQQEPNSSFGSFSPQAEQQPRSQSDAFGGLTDAFSGLSFPATTAPPPLLQKHDAFSNLRSFSNPKSLPAAPKILPRRYNSGGFFDSAPKPHQSRNPSISSGPDFNLAGPTMGSTKTTAASPAASKSSFDQLSSISATTSASPPTDPPKTVNSNSIFNLSAPAREAATVSPPPTTTNVSSMLSSSAMDPWGGNAWNTTETTTPAINQTSTSMMKAPDTITANDIGSGWGSPSPASIAKPAPTISADEDFGGWTSAPPPAPTSNATSKPKPAGGFSGNDDLFSNVWE